MDQCLGGFRFSIFSAQQAFFFFIYTQPESPFNIMIVTPHTHLYTRGLTQISQGSLLLSSCTKTVRFFLCFFFGMEVWLIQAAHCCCLGRL